MRPGLPFVVSLGLLVACDKAPASTETAAASAPKAAADSQTSEPPAQGDANKAKLRRGLDRSFLTEVTRHLSTDEMAGRLPGSPGAAKASAYLVQTMQSIGLVGAGNDGGFTQAVPMRSVSLDSAASQFAFVKAGKREPLVVGEAIVASSYAAAGDHRIDAPLVFFGYGVTAPEQQWDDYDNVDLSGKIAVVFVGDPPVTDGRFGGSALTYYGRWTYKFERALELGAKGCLVIHEDAPASYGWNVVQSGWTGERFDIVAPDGKLPPALPVQGWISASTAETLAQHAGSTLAQWHELAISPEFRPVDTGVKLQADFRTTERRMSDSNIAGMIRGNEQPDHAVILTAHWDHLGTKPDAAAGEDAIYNGAIDNASGTATLLAIASEVKARAERLGPPKRSIVFLAVTAEEQGLLGSKYYTHAPTIPLANVAGVINMDSVNVWGRTRNVQVIGKGQSTLEDTLAMLAEKQGRVVVADERPERGSYYRSDHFSFARKGVPAIFFSGGKDFEQGGTAEGQRLAAIKAEHYHTIDDEFDPAWTFDGAIQDGELMLDLAWTIANDATLPTWKPGSEFAAVPR